MYSLYRAWLSLGPCGGLAPSIPSLPTSTLSSPLNLSTPSQLPGVPDVSLQVGPGMTQFSAHKAVLSAHSGFFKAALSNQTGTSPIIVPNINVDEFSSLLTFMYTGYLDLNITNIYSILLATHILHMPRALEICRSFLLQTQTMENRTNIIKPIPSRKAMLPTQPVYAPTYSNLQKHEDTPFKTVTSEKQEPSQASTSKGEEEIPQPQTTTTTSSSEKKVNTTEKRINPVERQRQKKRSDGVAEKIIIDIACCDGPVRFHRVINKNYGLQNTNTGEGQFEVQDQINRNAAMNKVMNENIRDKQMSDENQTQGNELFTCLYCNHTFKSQYCYQKHARRHLNPVNMEIKPVQKENVKREVKLLDMNVQYYPCKSCGSKFPSYYFVHKHRKLCHAEEMADSSGKSNNDEAVAAEISAVSNNSDTNNTNGSNIDVEAINTDN